MCDIASLRLVLRRFRETVGKVDISVGPISFRLDRDDFEKAGAAYQGGRIVVRR